MLGHVLEDLRRGGDPVTLLGEQLDIVVLARAHAAAAAQGESLDGYARQAVQRFLNQASEADWAQLIGYLRDGRPAAPISLDVMLRRALREDGFGG
jgi:hypothetical protein